MYSVLSYQGFIPDKVKLWRYQVQTMRNFLAQSIFALEIEDRGRVQVLSVSSLSFCLKLKPSK